MLDHSYKGQRELLCFPPSYVFRILSLPPTNSRPAPLALFPFIVLLHVSYSNKRICWNRFTILRHFGDASLSSHIEKRLIWTRFYFGFLWIIVDDPPCYSHTFQATQERVVFTSDHRTCMLGYPRICQTLHVNSRPYMNTRVFLRIMTVLVPSDYRPPVNQGICRNVL